MTVAGLLLAAGGGRRFGRPKAMVPFRGERLVERGVRLLDDAGCAPVVVVLGADAGVADVAGVAPGRATVVVNDRWASGLSSSLRAGVETLEESACDAVVVALADQPLVTAAAVRRLLESWEAGAVAAVATYGGSPRNPVLLDRTVWHAVLAAATGDRGARPWLARHPGLVTHVECGDVAAPDDIDTPTDHARLERREPTWG